MTEYRATIQSDPFRVFDRTEAMALPQATLTKVYAEFKLFGFDFPNANKDGFLAEDVTDAAVQTLIGAPVYVARSLDEHPAKDASAAERAQYVIGGVVLAEKRADGVYCVASLQRDTLKARGIDPDRLERDFAVSMEVTFDRRQSRYRIGSSMLAFVDVPPEVIEARAYDTRFIRPLDFHGVATLIRGRNADKGANFIRVAADKDDDDPFQVSDATVERIQRSDS